MERLNFAFVVVALLSTGTAFGAPPTEIVVSKPSVVCPQTQLGNEQLQAQYKKAWSDFQAEVDLATSSLETELDTNFAEAQKDGNLNLALMWDGLRKQFRQLGDLRWDSATERKTWKQRFGETNFPNDLAGSLKRCDQGYKQARERLEEGYKNMERTLTQAGDFEQALKVRAELTAVLSGHAGPNPAPKPNPQPQPVPQDKPRVVGRPATTPPEATITPSKAILATDPIVNSVRMKLKLLPAGTFMMGDADGRDAEQPPHQVTIRQPFYLGIHEVTNAQWRRVMGQVPSDSKDEAHPVEKVSWHDAVLFCRKLSDMPTERNLGHVYRLPTEAEWEYACRAGTTTKYSFGNDAKLLGDYAWFAVDGNSTTPSNPVGQKRPNPWGLFDMHGNVWEWCSDWYGDYDSHAVTDPQGPTDGTHRVRRGGGWYVSASGCFSSLRTFEDPTRSNNFHGFRVAMTVAESSSVRTPAAVTKP